MAGVLKFDDRIELMEIVQFLVSNIYERNKFGQADGDARVQDLVDEYNRIIDRTETDPSLKIALI